MYKTLHENVIFLAFFFASLFQRFVYLRTTLSDCTVFSVRFPLLCRAVVHSRYDTLSTTLSRIADNVKIRVNSWTKIRGFAQLQTSNLKPETIDLAVLAIPSGSYPHSRYNSSTVPCATKRSGIPNRLI